MELAKHFIRTNVEPEWMVLCLLPVLPPELRPIIQIDGGKPMSSDINELYRRVIYRNNTLTDLLTISRSTPGELVMCQEKLVQEAVDTLLDNGIRGQPMRDGHNKVYKSFSDIIEGKEGRFRETMLGKRVDYSGRSVIVVGPSLSLHRCGLPREIAIELFQTFVIRGLIRQHVASNIGVAKSKIREKDPIVWEILQDVMQGHPVLLNRAPTLHRLGIQAFQPILVEGRAICLHPLVCKGFNADFDGDQMAVHVPLSLEAQAEARLLMFSHMNLLSPAIGDPICVPTQDMLMGLYVLTMGNRRERADLVFHNKAIDGTAMKRLISRLIDHFGMAYTSHILDQVKTLGFQQATATSISLGIDDLLTIPSKGWLVQDAEQQSFILEKHHHYGNVHAVEKLRQSIEIWYATSEYLRQEMNSNFRMTDASNPVHIMSFSGARGNASQVHQLVGMRGLMSDPQGQMIDLPIQSNLREGLSLTEYIISCYGARKGVVDTAVRTSDAGYLTRRLVEVVQHIVVRRTDCGTIRGISMSPRNGMMTERIFIQTLIGRVLADDIYMGSRCIAIRNQDIGIGLVNKFITFRAQPISIRTPFTCRSTSWICRLCYGRSPTHGDLVELGEAVGIIAGQSIGEPGTQLTLRTFHTGGVFTGGTAEHVRAPSNGKIKFNEDLVHPTRTRHGHPAFLCYIDLYVTIESQDILHNVNIPPKSFLLVQNDQYVESEQVIAEIRAGTSTLNFKERVRKHIYSDSEGEMHWSTDVYHAPEYTYGNVHLLPKTSHLWILSGDPYRSSIVPFSLHKDQDQMNIHSLSVEQRSISKLSVTNDQARHKLFGSDFSDKKADRILDYSRPDRIVRNSHCNFLYPAILYENSDLLAKRRRNRFIIPFQSNQQREKEQISRSGISIEIPINGIFRRNSILAYFDDPRYRRNSSGITKYGTIGVHSIVKKEDLIEYRGTKEVRPKYQMKIDRFFFIPEEVHILPGSSSIMVLIVHVDSLVIRSAKPYLATPGATVHGHYGEILYEGDTLVTFIYEKSRSGDITQGLPKVEQVLEVRSIDSISMNLEKRIEGWNERITRILGSPWVFLIGAELTIAQSRISLVNKIQKVYRSQGVQIHNRHIEIIVRQITSKVLVSEDGMSNVFLPGELIGLLRAERTGRALEEAICYRAVLLGITKASLNTQSFISEASFQETARVLAKAALRGRIDWLKGLKENVVLGGIIPVGTGFKGLVHRLRQHSNIFLVEIKKKNLFEGDMRDILFHHRELFDSCISNNFHDTSEQLGFTDS
ncbi:hypothetical protein GIB67_021732 [Kingdonia uniflora]|uniref:DNA-directed RNA polymerase subunit n=1 Tax=Kingdonia uniflora TaxID=39325 RepID=A0A7J7KXF9_9MAGN|nr:hypothetical protein GIB67_021732 [Kingdonia uniflora]